MDEAAIREFIDGLTDARGFATTTTAIDGWPTPSTPVTAREWINDVYVRAALRHLEHPDDPPWCIAVVAGDERTRMFEQGPCEERSWFTERLRREVRDIADPWLFFLLPVTPRPEDLTGLLPAVHDHCGATGWLMWWFAEARARGQAWQQQGAAARSLRGCSQVWSHTWLDLPPWFERILRGHPARRRNPIRRA